MKKNKKEFLRELKVSNQDGHALGKVEEAKTKFSFSACRGCVYFSIEKMTKSFKGNYRRVLQSASINNVKDAERLIKICNLYIAENKTGEFKKIEGQDTCHEYDEKHGTRDDVNRLTFKRKKVKS